ARDVRPPFPGTVPRSARATRRLAGCPTWLHWSSSLLPPRCHEVRLAYPFGVYLVRSLRGGRRRGCGGRPPDASSLVCSVLVRLVGSEPKALSPFSSLVLP